MLFFFFQAEDGIRDYKVTGVQTCALPISVQSQLQKVVEAAMAVTKRSAQSGQMDVSTGSFGIYPRYGKDNKVEGWQGRAEILLQGRDFARITQTAAQVQDMTLSQVGFGLSREAREKVDGEAQADRK